MTNRANTPEQVVRQWISEAQRSARRMVHYQKALDDSVAQVHAQIARLESHASRLRSHERRLREELRGRRDSAPKG